MARLSAVLLLVLAAAACGPDLPESVPPVQLDGGTLPDGGALPDAGPVEVDAGPPDAGEAFLARCADAGCDDGACEPLADAGVACGVVCGDACTQLCQEARCDAPAGWGAAYCTSTGSGLRWSPTPGCDDGNACTVNDACSGGACAGTAAPSSATCDDGNVCTGGDHCDGAGHCAGSKVTASPVNRFLNGASPPANYIYGSPGEWTSYGYGDQGTIFQGSAAGDRVVYMLHNGGTDRVLSKDQSEGAYDGPIAVGTGFSSQKPGTTKLLRYKLASGSGHCTNGGDSQCHFFTASASAQPAGSSLEETSIWVCPP
jgi:hypothetical protein